jgi:hypothetical protein
MLLAIGNWLLAKGSKVQQWFRNGSKIVFVVPG